VKSGKNTVTPPQTLSFASEQARYASFGRAIDAIHQRAKARVGAEDLAHIRRIDRISRVSELTGRGLLMLGPGPLSFAAGVGCLFVHKQLQTTEIGHTVLHGAFNRIEGAQAYHSGEFDWQVPVDERSWMAGHNGMHHGLTNVAGNDPDIDFGHARLTEHTPHRFVHYFQVPITLLTFPVFMTAINAHVTGIIDLYVRSPEEPLHFAADRSPESKRAAWSKFNSKARRYYARELLLFPALAGPRFARVLVGNLMSEAMRDVYTAATIYCGHLGEDVTSFAEGTRPESRGERYAMQVTSANNFEVGPALSVLCGALDLQIEHHLFPKLPTNRLREVAPEVEAACAEHGIAYRSASWPKTLAKSFRQLWKLSTPAPLAASAA
jgi:linoleoyl-CoA desaturase